MNKADIITILAEKVKCSTDEAGKVASVIEENFSLFKDKKEDIVNLLMNQLSWDKERVERTYEAAMEVIKGTIVQKIKNPFGPQK